MSFIAQQLKIIGFSLVMLLPASLVLAGDSHDLSIYPQAQAGHIRQVISLAKRTDEANHKVELVIGKQMMVDCNYHRMSGTLEEKTVQGFTYYHFSSNGQVSSTRKACFTPKKKGFVAATHRMIRYNSKLPIVLYTPKGISVQYHIWSKETPSHFAVEQ